MLFRSGNLAQGIINASKNIIHTSKTATNMVSNFQETVKIYQQGKKYYDALKSVNNLVKDARKVQQTILMVGDITDIYVNSFQRMLRDGNFRPEELSAIAFGYTKLLEESAHLLNDLKTVVNEMDMTVPPEEENITLNGESSGVIAEENAGEEKTAMVRNVVLQTITYLAAVIVSILVLIFIVSRHNMVRKNFTNYNIIQYKVENYTGMLASTVKEAVENCGIRVEQELVESDEYQIGRAHV